MNSKNVIILGAGISGLSTAHWLNRAGYKVLLLEIKNAPGGSMITEQSNGFLIDYGPNSGLETSPKIKELVEQVHLTNEMIYANKEGNKRYILKENKLIPLPTDPLNFFKTDLFSWKAKFRLLKEPFVKKSEDGYYQSIASFVERRLGKEFLDYAIDPFVSGVFAGDPYKLSVKSAFPKLYRLEEKYGGLIKGMIKGAKERKQRKEESKQSARMFSFRNGMQSLPKAIAKTLNEKIIYNAQVNRIFKENGKWNVEYSVDKNKFNLSSDVILSTIPSYQLSKILSTDDEKMIELLNKIYYPPVIVLYVGYNLNQIGRKLDGFGFLVPSKERKSFLGAIWSSTIFENRAGDEKASFTIFIGGARNPEVRNTNINTLIDSVLAEFQEIMNVQGKPILIKYRLWEKAIPQYNLGYIEYEKYFDEFEKLNPGIFISGNFRGGISVGDCIKNSYLLFEKIKEF